MDNNRYSCQIALPGFGAAAQEKLRQAKVLIVGAGGLGCPAAQYLASSGIGVLGIADDDQVDEGNLHRQILYTPADIGQPKALTAAQKLQAQNPDIQITPHELKVTSKNVTTLFERYDIIVDGTDNFEARYLLNDAAVLAGKPLIYGAIYQYEGQVAVWNIANPDGSRSPNYRDLYPKVDPTQVPNCVEGGVIPTLAGMVGCIQANEAIKYITQTGELLAGKLLLLNTLSLQTRTIRLGHSTQTNIIRLPLFTESPIISAAALREMMNSPELELIDIRSGAEHDELHIGGRHVPAHRIESLASSFRSDKQIVLYCSGGRRSADVVQRLLAVNPELNVVSLEGGIQAWLKQVRA